MDTQYEVFITPFYKSILGLPSASRLAKTRHALPSRAPVLTNLTLTSDSLAVNWRSLDDVFTNGVLQGYDVRVNVSGGGGGVVINVNPADTEAVIKLADLIINGDSSIADEDLVGDSGVNEVSVEVAAVNKAGTGPFSPPQVRSVDFSLVNRGGGGVDGGSHLYKLEDEADDGSGLVTALVLSLFLTVAVILGVIIFFRQRFSRHRIFMEKMDTSRGGGGGRNPRPADHQVKNQSLWIDQRRRWNGDNCSGDGSNASKRHLLGGGGGRLMDQAPADQFTENEYACIAGDRGDYALPKQDAGLEPYASTDILGSQFSGSIYNNRYIVSKFLCNSKLAFSTTKIYCVRGCACVVCMCVYVCERWRDRNRQTD